MGTKHTKRKSNTYKTQTKDLQTEQRIHNFIQDKLEQSKQKENKCIPDNEMPIYSHTTSKSVYFENHSSLSHVNQLQN